MTNTVELRGVTKRYGAIEAVRDVTFDLPVGETTALVGHNGAGKTTLLKLMLGLIHPTAGTLRVLGENPAAGEFAARRALGYLPESVSFNAALTGREILTFYARLKREPVEKALPLLEKVGLAAAANRRVGTYSKGMRQRLGLAQALIGAPKVLLLDEPTTGLDPALRLSFYEIVEELRGRGATVVLCSHALTETEERARRVIIMNRGIMVAHGSMDELRRLASLPTRIRLKPSRKANGAMGEWLRPVPQWREVHDGVIEIDAAHGDKIALLRRATAPDAPFEDVEVFPPTLDELYAHFLQRQEDGR
jgi:Cu-processing system ATP-binding protein